MFVLLIVNFGISTTKKISHYLFEHIVVYGLRLFKYYLSLFIKMEWFKVSKLML